MYPLSRRLIGVSAPPGHTDASFFRKVSLLTAAHGLPPSLFECVHGPASTGELTAGPLPSIGPFEMLPLDDAYLDDTRLVIRFYADMIGGSLVLHEKLDEEQSGSPGSSGLWFDQPAVLEFSGELSPVWQVTLDAGQREAVGIPPEASHFAFVYPCEASGSGGDDGVVLKKKEGLRNFLDVGVTAQLRAQILATFLAPCSLPRTRSPSPKQLVV